MIGLAILVWVLYGTSTQGAPGSAGRFLSLVVGLFMVLISVKWFRQIFSGPRKGQE